MWRASPPCLIMDDLIAYVRALLRADAALLALWTAAGKSSVDIGLPNGQDAATFPRLVLDARLGDGVPTGEGQSCFENGSLAVYTFAKQSDATPTPATLCWQIDRRLCDLLMGSRRLSLPGLTGVRLPSSEPGQPPRYAVTVFRNAGAGGMGADSTPQVRRLMRSFRVQLSKL